MKSKKLLSLLLAVIMIMSAVPMFASAAEPIALTEANVVEWPTVDKELYYGQKAKYDLTLIGGVVTADGTTNGAIIEGTWEFTDADDYFPAAGTRNANIRFIPSDSATYTGFEVKNSKIVLYKVNKPLPVLVDENDPPVATEVEPGAKLSTSTLSGGQVKNPYNPDEPKALAGVWRWTKTTTVVNESGYYQARMVLANYEVLYMDVYVKVASDIPEISIAEYPTVPELTYNPNITWADIELTGGKAVLKGTDTEVEGTFAIKDTRLAAYPNPNFTEIEVVFTPDDPEAALPYEFKIPVNVNPLPISFGEDHKGTSIDDPFVYEVNPNTRVGDVLSRLQGGQLNYPTLSVVEIEDANSYAENGRVYKITVLNYDSTNYTGSEAYVKTVFKNVEFAVSSVSYAPSTEEINVKFNSNKFPGTFDVYVDGKLIGDDVPRAGDHIDVPYKLETSGKHTVKVVYNPIENDYYFMADYETEIQVNVARNITTEGLNSTLKVNGSQYNSLIVNGAEISVECVLLDVFAGWEITDTNGNAIDLGVDLTANKITFTMPDQDIVIKAKSTLDEEEKPDDGTGDDANNGIFESICSFLQKIISWFISIIKQMMSLLGLGA